MVLQELSAVDESLVLGLGVLVQLVADGLLDAEDGPVEGGLDLEVVVDPGGRRAHRQFDPRRRHLHTGSGEGEVRRWGRE